MQITPRWTRRNVYLEACQFCGAAYFRGGRGTPGADSKYCEKHRGRNDMHEHVCRTCGVTFEGVHNALDCPSCRAERIRREKNLYRTVPKLYVRVRNCEACGKPFFPEKGTARKYCSDDCVRQVNKKASFDAWRALSPAERVKQNEQRKRYYHDPENKPKLMQQHREYARRQAATLSDQYIRKLIAKHSRVLTAADIPQAFVDLKRAELQLKRQLKEEL